MGYNKSIDWYISRELRPVGKKLEKWINKRGTPKVRVEVKRTKLFINAPYYAKFQDKGVAGNKSGKSLAGYKFKGKMPPPVVFEKYTSDVSEQFAIAKSIQKKGFKAKKYIDKGVGHFAPQVSAAIKRGTSAYIKIEIFPPVGVIKIG